MGVIFFIYNAVFSTILLIIVLVASIIAIVAKNPDTRYQPMRDDRGSFIKSQSQLTTELDALGATARGESKHGFTNNKGARIEDDEDDSYSGSSSDRNHGHYNQPAAPYGNAPQSRSNVNSAAYGSDAGSGRHMGAPSYQSRTASPYDQVPARGHGASPSPWQRGAGYD
jgi:hypothetical protein